MSGHEDGGRGRQVTEAARGDQGERVGAPVGGASMQQAAVAGLGAGMLQRKIARRLQRRGAGQAEMASGPEGAAAEDSLPVGAAGHDEHKLDAKAEHKGDGHGHGHADEEDKEHEGAAGAHAEADADEEGDEAETEDGGDAGGGDEDGGDEVAEGQQRGGAHAAHAAGPVTAPETGARAAGEAGGGTVLSSGPTGTGGSGGTASGGPSGTASTGTGSGAALSITSVTQKAAAAGANNRTTVGIGEVVDLTSTAAGTWKASKGTLSATAAQPTTTWTAPARPGSATITVTVGKKHAKKKFKIVAPKKLSMVVASQHGLTAGVAGVCMLTNVTVGPTHVSFGNVQWLEVPGPATGVSGYFKQFSAATLHHNPNPSWLTWNDSNTGLQDHAAWHSVPAPYKRGAFRWKIPNKYRVVGSSTEKKFTTTTQQFRMTDKHGTMSVSKAGASVSRTP